MADPTDATLDREPEEISPSDLGGNFWEIGKYKVALKRINTGAKLCDEFVHMMAERAAIEKQYAKGLLTLAERWEDRMRNLGEFGTLLDGWRSVLTEARGMADIHSQLKDRLETEMTEDVERWKKDHYVKSFFQWKQYRRAATAFEKAQEPWARRREKLLKYKKHLETHTAQADVARQGLAGAADGAKAQSQLDKHTREAEKYRQKLHQRVQDMINTHESYQREMTLEFERCQEEEKVRIEFFKTALQLYHVRTDIARNFDSVHTALYQAVQRVSPADDMSRFAREHGAEMPFLLPTEDGTFRPASVSSSRSRTATAARAGPIAPAASVPAVPSAPVVTLAVAPTVYAAGSRLRAIYDYVATKADELTLKLDDVLIVLDAPQTEGGWILVRNDVTGVQGIVPENYVEQEV